MNQNGIYKQVGIKNDLQLWLFFYLLGWEMCYKRKHGCLGEILVDKQKILKSVLCTNNMYMWNIIIEPV